MAVPLSNLTATFTSANGNTAIKMTVSDSANSVNSNLINIIVNNQVIFRVDRFGNVTANTLNISGSITANSLNISGSITANSLNVVSVSVNSITANNLNVSNSNIDVFSKAIAMALVFG